MNIDECKSVGPLLVPYTDDELDTERRAEVERHIDTCSLCRDAVNEYRTSLDAITLNLVPPPAAGSCPSARAVIRRATLDRRRTVRRVFATATAARDHL